MNDCFPLTLVFPPEDHRQVQSNSSISLVPRVSRTPVLSTVRDHACRTGTSRSDRPVSRHGQSTTVGPPTFPQVRQDPCTAGSGQPLERTKLTFGKTPAPAGQRLLVSEYTTASRPERPCADSKFLELLPNEREIGAPRPCPWSSL